MSFNYKAGYSLLLVHACLALFLFSSNICQAIDNITLSHKLSQHQTLISPGRVFELGFFGFNHSGNHQYVGIWYKEGSPRTLVWVANRENPVRVTNSPASLRIGESGYLELVDRNDTSLWSTSTAQIQSNSSVATLSDKGNLVLKDGGSGETLWQSFDHPGDTFLPGSVLGFNAKTGQRYILTSWRSETDPSLGSFTAGLVPNPRPAQFVIWNGSTPFWRSGPWGRLKFIGLPDMESSYQSPFSLVEDAEQQTTFLNINLQDSSVAMKMYVTWEGILKVTFKRGDSNWTNDWASPTNPCDLYGFCGPFGVCKKVSDSPTCSCLKGFVPKSDPEWRRGNWTQGCLRRAELECEKNTSTPNSQRGKTDVFHKFHNAKLPDIHEYVMLPSNIDSCQTWCLSNCSCKSYAYVNGIGCLIWSEDLVDIQEFTAGGEDLFLRLAQGELDGGQNKKKIIIISVVTIFSGATLCALLLVFLRQGRANQTGNVEETKEISLHNPSEFPIFDFNTIEVATDNFNMKNKLGQGGFGPVYKGKLQDRTEIAVKRLASSSGQGMEEFKNEMILISKLQHRNLVKLIGYCIDKDERLLIYEFMPNKSLDNFLFDSNRRAELSWITRFNILNGVARGLVYLHRDSSFRVIHRDLKAGNILLDAKMNPKISDFGLARIFQGTTDLANTHRVVGTLGYMSPEYALGGIFSEKSDVFSFGILMLEIVSGTKNTSFRYYEEHLSLIAYAWHLWSEGRAIEMVDKALEGSYSSAEAMRCVHIGLLCVQDQAVDRPSMPDIVSMLSNEKDCPIPKEPLFTLQRPSQFQQQSDSKCSANEATMSLIEGR